MYVVIWYLPYEVVYYDCLDGSSIGKIFTLEPTKVGFTATCGCAIKLMVDSSHLSYLDCCPLLFW